MEQTAQPTKVKAMKSTGRKANFVKGASGGKKKEDTYFKVGSGRRSAIENLVIANRQWDFATKQKVLKFISKMNG